MAVGHARLHGHLGHPAARHRALRQSRPIARSSIFLIVVAALGVAAAAGIRHSRLGRAFVAIAGSEDAARALGIDVARYKLAAFLISAFYAAVAGSLFVHAVGFVSPEVYGLHMVVLAFTMLYVGGIGTVAGAALGALVIGILPETVRALQRVSGSRLWRAANPDPHLRARRPRVALAPVHAQEEGGRMSLLTLEKVTQRFGGLVAVDDVSLDIKQGGITAIIGPNGAGKTTLFNAISGFRTPTEGRVAFDGDDITGLAPERAARRGLVRTFQLVQLFETLTVLENVKVGRHLHTSGGLLKCADCPGARVPSRRRSRTSRAVCLHRVGLAAQAEMIASALPYGQKRLARNRPRACGRAQAAPARRTGSRSQSHRDEPSRGRDPRRSRRRA